MICPPWWPLPDDEPIGDDRARELMAYLKSAVPAVVAAVSAYLIARHPEAEIQAYAITTATLAKQSLGEHMRGVSIGSVSVPGSSGRAETVGIAFTREGRIAWTVAVEGSQYQEWRVL
jgi:hypothetical protein